MSRPPEERVHGSEPVAFYVWVESKLGGSERRFLRLFDHLRASHPNVHLFTSSEGIAALDALGISSEGDTIHVLGADGEHSGRVSTYAALAAQTLKLCRSIRRLKIRHIHFGQNPAAATFVYSLVSRIACPFSVSLVDSIKSYQVGARKRLFTSTTVRRSTVIDCLSEQIRDDLCDFFGQELSSKCLVAPCSFTNLEAVPAPENRDIDVAIIGRMVPGKGHELLQCAIAELERIGRSGLVVHICGWGPLEDGIRRGFAKLEHQRIHIHAADDPFAVLARTKVFVSLQEAENYPSQSLLEAMACECSIVATDVGLTRKLLDESCAILVPPDPTALATAIATLLDDEQLRLAIAREGALRVRKTQTIERFAGYLMDQIFGVSAD